MVEIVSWRDGVRGVGILAPRRSHPLEGVPNVMNKPQLRRRAVWLEFEIQSYVLSHNPHWELIQSTDAIAIFDPTRRVYYSSRGYDMATTRHMSWLRSN